MVAGGTMDLIKLLGLEHSFSRPRTSDHNPYSESQFRPLKYHSRFPAYFESKDDAEGFLTHWFKWYNYEHRHTGLILHTAASVHSAMSRISSRNGARSWMPPSPVTLTDSKKAVLSFWLIRSSLE